VTSDPRLRIGGWAALFVAVLVPLQFVALFIAAPAADPFKGGVYLAVEAVRVVATLVAVLGLDVLFRSIASGPARLALAAGGLGAVIGIATGAVGYAGLMSEPVETIAFLASSLLLATWFVIGGGILLGEGGPLARIGWTAELGGIGMILTALAIATSFGGAVGVTGTSLLDWFHLLGLFVVVYLVRVWRYVVGGRLPGPGIL
jgi:hypothetical protein